MTVSSGPQARLVSIQRARPGRRVIAVGAFCAVLAVCVYLAVMRPAVPAIGSLLRNGPVTVLPAQIQPADTVVIRSEVSGIVESVQVAPGDNVAAGQLLASIASPDAKAEVARAAARVAVLESKVASLRSANVSDTSERLMRTEQLENARRALAAADERLNEFSVADAEKAWKEAKTHSDAVQELAKHQIATRQEVETAAGRERALLQELRSAREHWSRLRQERGAAALQLHMIEAGQTGAAPDRKTAELELVEAKTELNIAREHLQSQSVTAPRPGKVMEVNDHVGERVLSGAVLFRIADITELVFEVPITPQMAREVRTGTPVIVRIPTDPPSRVNTTVSSVSLAADASRHYYVARVRIPSPNPTAVLAGLEGAVEFSHSER